MTMLLQLFVALVALEHLWFFVLEAFLWTAPIGLRTFRNTPEKAAQTKVLAMNQGVYNALLAAGLVWGLVHPTVSVGVQIEAFFLGLVVVAGLAGGITVSRSILVIQALPAAIGLAIAGTILLS